MNKKKRIVAAGIIVLAAAVLLLILFDSGYYLILSHDGKTVFAGSEEGFSIRYIHSVNKTPVTEIFCTYDGRIILYALEFESFGAGMPTELEPGQSLINLPCGGMRIEGFNREMNELFYIVGHTSEHTLVLSDREIPLITLAEAGSVIRFEYRRLGFRESRRGWN